MPDPAQVRPTVTVSGADGPSKPPDVLQGGRDRPSLGPVGRRRVLLAAGLATLLVAGALAADRVRESRALEAEAARTAGVVALAVGRSSSSAAQIGGDVGALRFRLAVRLAVRNDGPRPVQVTGGELGPYRAAAAPPIEPGQAQDVVLERLVVCPVAPAIPPAERTPDAVALEVETAAGPRSTRLALPPEALTPLAEAVRRACGVLTLADALLVVPAGAQRRGTLVTVDLQVGNVTSRRVRLTQLVVQQGLRGVVRGPGGASLPLDLPPREPSGEVTTVPLQVELSVASCRSIFELTPAPPGALSLDTLLATVEDASGMRTQPLAADLDVPALDGLVSDIC